MGVTGVVIGKFLPLHRGHRSFIERSAAMCDELFVLVTGRDEEEAFAPLAVREAWLRELVETDRVHVRARMVNASTSNTDPAVIAFWGGVILDMIGRPSFDLLFTSERHSYGDAEAAYLGVRHVCVDPDRVEVPISGTVVRADPLAAWGFLDPPVRAYFAKRVRIVGGESSGKTTLADLTARRFATSWVTEWGRAYSDRKDSRHESWSTSDFVAIAAYQGESEDLAARRSSGLVVCDTDPMTTGIWHGVYLGSRAPVVDAVGAGRRYDLTMVAGDEIGWVQDGFRHSAAERSRQKAEIIARLGELGSPYVYIAGPREARVEQAAAAIAGTTGLLPPDEGRYWLELGLSGRWRYLSPREHPWRRSLFVDGTSLSAPEAVEELYRMRTDYETAARIVGAPAEALREADWFCSRNIELAHAEDGRDHERIAAHTGIVTSASR